MSAALAVAALVVELCVAPPPTATRSRAEATAYVAVGDAERTSGHAVTAAVAYRAALAHDPTNAPARAGLDAVCATESLSPAMALLAAIDRYHAGDLPGARSRLEVAAQGPAELAAGAHFFLGMIAVRSGQRQLALAELAHAAAEPSYATAALEMRRLVRRQGPVVLSLLVAPEWDSNVGLLADNPATGNEVAADGDLMSALAVTVRSGRVLSLAANALVRKRFRLTDHDLMSARGAASLEQGKVQVVLGGGADVVGGEAYGGVVSGSVTAHLGPLDARYELRRRLYWADDAADYTGWIHGAVLVARGRPATGLELSVEVLGERELTRADALDAWAVGGTLGAAWRPLAGLRLGISADARGAFYDDGQRRDLRYGGELEAELDVSDHLSLVAALEVLRQESTFVDSRYLKVVARAGVSGTLGLP